MQHILVMGTGAVGGYYGAQLASAEHLDVTFIARGAQYDALKKNGLRITGLTEMHIDPVQVMSDPSGLTRPPDLVLVAVKSFDTPGAIELLRPVAGNHTRILTIQNGLENYELLADAFGSQNVIRGFCKIGVEVIEPGVIEYRGLSSIIFGEEDGKPTNRVLQIQKIMEHAGINAEVSGDIRKEAWLKFMWNGIFNMLTGLADVTTDAIFREDAAYATAWQLFYEMQAIARAQGVPVSDKDGAGVIDRTKSLGAFKTSTWQDRRKNKPLEYDTFCGYIVRKSERYELDVPVNRALLSLYRMMEQAG